MATVKASSLKMISLMSDDLVLAIYFIMDIMWGDA
jgi:hypothetical protein